MDPLIIHGLGLTISYECNIQCEHCCVGSYNHRNTLPPTFEKCKDIIDKVALEGHLFAIGLSGGEPLIFYDLVCEILTYSKDKYGLEGALTTNCLWAASVDIANSFLSKLYNCGLRNISLSVDQFHQKFVPIQNAINVIEAAKKNGVQVTIQTIKTNGEWDIDHTKKLLEGHSKDCIRFVGNNFTPSGNARTLIPRSAFPQVNKVSGGCSIFHVINVDLDGNIIFCCGPVPRDLKHLAAGNLFNSKFRDLYRKAAFNPVYNTLFLDQGPFGLMTLADEELKTDFMHRDYTSACHACMELFNSDCVEDLISLVNERAAVVYCNRIYIEKMRRDKYIAENGSELLRFRMG